jgi:hypothetical protein
VNPQGKRIKIVVAVEQFTRVTNPQNPWKAGSIGAGFKPFWIGLRPIVFYNRDDGATIHLAAPNARRKTTET